MGSISDFLETALLDHIFNGAGQAYTPGSSLYIGLSTANPGDDAAGMAEPSGNGYTRVTVTASSFFNAAATRKITQAIDCDFPTATGSWGTISHWFICNHATNTNWGTDVELLAHGGLGTPKLVVSGNQPSIKNGSNEIEIEFKTLAGKGTGENISDYLANVLLNFAFRNQSFSQPDTYIGYATANLADDTTGSTVTECANANGYARKQVNDNGGSSPTWDLAASGTLDNTHNIDSGPPTGSWGLITALFITDSGTYGSGNILFYENDAQEQTPGDGDTVRIEAGACDVSLT